MTRMLELHQLRPMLLSEVRPALAPDGPDWTVEVKFDGWRIMSAIDRSGARLQSRNGADATSWYPELQSLSSLPAGTMLDGEACVLDEIGRSDFDRLQARSRRRGRPPGSDAVTYCVFDLLFLRGKDLRAQPFAKRKAALTRLLTPAPPSVLLVQDLPGQVRWLYEQALALKLEGVVAKRLDSPYLAGERSESWLKVKRPGAVPPQRFKR